MSSGSSFSLPHALTVAHQKLRDCLDRGIKQWGANLRYSNGREICSAVEGFVDELWRVPAWWAELQRRAGLVESSCGPGSKFRQAMDAAWQQSRTSLGEPLSAVSFLRCWQQSRASLGEPEEPEVSAATFDFQRLEQDIQRPVVVLQDLAQMRQQLKQVIESGFLDVSGRAAFEGWSDECRAIQKEAAGLEVDGCHYLYHIHQGAKPNPSDRSQIIRATIEGGSIAGGMFEPMRAAAESLLAWACEHLPEREPRHEDDDRLPLGFPLPPKPAGGTP